MTGAPGAGRTALLEALREQDYAVESEAATDVISRRQAAGVDAPWERDDFIDEVSSICNECGSCCPSPRRRGCNCSTARRCARSLWRGTSSAR